MVDFNIGNETGKLSGTSSSEKWRQILEMMAGWWLMVLWMLVNVSNILYMIMWYVYVPRTMYTYIYVYTYYFIQVHVTWAGFIAVVMVLLWEPIWTDLWLKVQGIAHPKITLSPQTRSPSPIIMEHKTVAKKVPLPISIYICILNY